MRETIDYLVVGQGLSGSILAWLLERLGQRVLIVDNGQPDAASRIAAGIVNPVAGQRMVRYPNAEICLTEARALYASIGRYFSQDFYFERPMIRLFKSEKEHAIRIARTKDPLYQAYLGEGFEAGRVLPVAANRYGGFHQKNCGYLDTAGFLDAIRACFKSRNRLIEDGFSWPRIAQNTADLLWNGYRVRHILSCEGFQARGNPYFSGMPLQFSKGEIVTCATTLNFPETIVNQGQWLLPLENRRFKCGATYAWSPLDARPTGAALESLCMTARNLLPSSTDFQVLAHKAGIRPGSLDKMPIAGRHPVYRRLGFFNGFGSRGVLTIPYYAGCFARHLVHNANLPPEIALDRFALHDQTGRPGP